MKPAAAANQLTKVWREISPNGDPYPVDCNLLAEALGITVHGAKIDDQFEAQLRIREKEGKKHKFIIYNENIREEGRKNFCVSHEIGHNSCHVGQPEFLCTSKDLNDMAPHPENIEQEANLFAAQLLMPPDEFRKALATKAPSLELLSRIAEERFRTSLTATCKRLIDLSHTKAFGMAFVQEDGTVARWDRSTEMKWTGFGFRRGHRIPKIGFEHDPVGTRIESDVWLNAKNAPRWELTQSAVYMPYYEETLVLLSASRLEVPYSYDENETTGWDAPTFH